MSNNKSNGAAKLASVIQSRMNRVAGRKQTVSVELGAITAGKKLKIDSLPNAVLGKDDYLVCKTIAETEPLKNGDRVLVVWTSGDDPIVIDKVIEADKL